MHVAIRVQIKQSRPVQALARVIGMMCPWEGHFTLTVSLLTLPDKSWGYCGMDEHHTKEVAITQLMLKIGNNYYAWYTVLLSIIY